MQNPLSLIALALLTASAGAQQIPCPISWVSSQSTQDTIHLDFMNKGKVPIQQLSLTCSPPLSQKTRNALCHTESGLFYPGMQYSIDITYPGAARHPVTILVKSARLGDGSLWSSSSSEPCRTVRVSRGKKS